MIFSTVFFSGCSVSEKYIHHDYSPEDSYYVTDTNEESATSNSVNITASEESSQVDIAKNDSYDVFVVSNKDKTNVDYNERAENKEEYIDKKTYADAKQHDDNSGYNIDDTTKKTDNDMAFDEDKNNENTHNNIDITDSEREIFELINQERLKNGLPTLVWCDALYNVATIRAKESSIFWSHTRPNGLKLSSLFTGDELIDCTVCGENLASGFSSGVDAMSALMNSEGHKKNILSKKYSKVAVSIYVDSNNCSFIAQIFSN